MKQLLIIRLILTFLVLLYPVIFGGIYGYKHVFSFFHFLKDKYQTFYEIAKTQRDRVAKHTKKKDYTNSSPHMPWMTDKIYEEPTKEEPLSFEVFPQITPNPEMTEEKQRMDILLEKILHKANFYKDKGQFDLYEKKLIEGLALDPMNSIFTKKLADWYFHNNNQKKSLSLLKKIIEVHPNDHEALWQLGEIYLEQGEFSHAETLIERAISLAADRPKYYISLVEIKYNSKQTDEAISLMKKAIGLRPNNTGYLLAIAGLYEERGDLANAKKHYFDILEFEPTNTIARKKLNNL